MIQEGIFFFADTSPPCMGGIEMHAKEFIHYFKKHPYFPIYQIISKQRVPTPFSPMPKFLFFNSGHWIEKMSAIRAKFPKSFFIYRTGGNEILKAPLEVKKIASHKKRQEFWVNTLNQTLDLLITNSFYTQNRLRNLGITVPFYRCVGGAHTSSVSLFQPDPTTFRLFCAARFVPYKNHLLLIEIVNELVKQGNRVNLRLAGNGPLLSKAKKLAKGSSSIQFLGELKNEEVCNEIVQADAYIQLSGDTLTSVPGGSYIHSEGMGRSILEAISAGTYIIVGKSGALPEIVSPYEGTLTDTDSKEEILKTLKKVIKSRPKKGKGTIIYSWNCLFKTYETIYENLSRYRKVPSTSAST